MNGQLGEVPWLRGQVGEAYRCRIVAETSRELGMPLSLWTSSSYSDLISPDL